MSKRTRQQAIIEIVSKQQVASQAVLAEELLKRNFQATQATLSRDIAELNLVKSKDGYTTPQDAGAMTQAPDTADTLKRCVTKVNTASNLLVVKTTMGNAQPVAVALDSNDFEQIMGTLGGDDTVLVVTQSADEANALKDTILKLLQ